MLRVLLIASSEIIHGFSSTEETQNWQVGTAGQNAEKQRKMDIIVVWIENTFDDNFWIKNGFTKYLKEIYWWCSDLHFSFKYFANYALAWEISSKLARWFRPLWTLIGQATDPT